MRARQTTRPGRVSLKGVALSRGEFGLKLLNDCVHSE